MFHFYHLSLIHLLRESDEGPTTLSIMADLDLITNRRREVLNILESAHKAFVEAQAELAELDVTGKTLARLTGGQWPPPGQENSKSAPLLNAISEIPVVSRKVNGRVRTNNVTDMVMHVLKEAGEGGRPLMAPKEVRAAIQERFNFEVRPEYMSTTMWRLAGKGRLERNSDGLYGLPGAIEASLDPEARKLI